MKKTTNIMLTKDQAEVVAYEVGVMLMLDVGGPFHHSADAFEAADNIVNRIQKNLIVLSAFDNVKTTFKPIKKPAVAKKTTVKAKKYARK